MRDKHLSPHAGSVDPEKSILLALSEARKPEARDVLELVAVLDSVPVEPRDLAAPGETWDLAARQGLYPIADRVGRHRRRLRRRTPTA